MGEKSTKTAPLLIAVLVLIILPLPACEPGPTEVRVRIFRDGWVKVTEVFNVTEDYLWVVLPPDSEVVAVMSREGLVPFRQEENILYADLSNHTLENYSIVSVIYYSSSLTNKTGSIWEAEFSYNSTRLVVELPENATIAGLSLIPSIIAQKGGSLVLEFAGGEVELRYYIRLSVKGASTSATVNQTSGRPPGQPAQASVNDTRPSSKHGGRRAGVGPGTRVRRPSVKVVGM